MTVAADTLDDGRLTVNHDFVRLLHHHGLDTFESLYAADVGELLREVESRANVRLTLDRGGRAVTFFLKRHEPLDLLDRLRAWLKFRRPRTAARIEWENIERLVRLGIPTMYATVLGEDPVTGRSFLMTAAIESACPADDFAREHFTSHDKATVPARRKFVRRLGEIARRLHSAGLTHRDFYLCHVFVRETEDDFRLHLIDLQRLGPRVFKERWRTKDIAQLEFSRPAGTFSNTDALRFLLAYFDVGRLGPREKRFVRGVLRKVKRMKRQAAQRESR